MKKHIIKKGIGLAMAVMPLLGQAQEKKNVLFIAVDDLKPVLGCYGAEQMKTPNIDQLAKQGVVFMNNHCQQAVCAPSRASLLTGVRPDSTRVWDLKTKIRDKNPDILTLPQYFKNQGYTTTGVGKIYDRRSVDAKHDKHSWSEEFAFSGDEKYKNTELGEEVLGHYQSAETKEKVAFYTAEGKKKNKKRGALNKYVMKHIKPSSECVDVPDNAYTDGVLALSAIDRLERLSKDEKPFFLAVGFKKPHLPFVAPKKYWDLYDRNELPLAAYQKFSKNGPKIAYHKSGEIQSYSDIPKLKSFSDIGPDLLPEEKQRELIHGYYASVSYMDAQVGKVLQALDSLGLRENTIIVLWGDHGWHLGDHGLWCKHSNFEQATRSPLIFSAPEAQNGTKVNAPSEFVDIFPTLCELSGIEEPEHLAGTSLVPLLSGEKKSVKKYSVSQFRRGKAMGYAFRTERYRYVLWMGENFRTTQAFNKDLIVGEELYDYQKDELETRNLIGNKEYKKVYEQMKATSVDFFQAQFKR
ncbi:sulfatase [Marinifilum breve]|uniref:Sulfatase n=1 Tax=Marinifilum breve TaxID=2184082 RepID=A0A2V4A3J8_9BACT|nr:sulfatase [Marinifilum breve]PXY03162.1 sulfatase [Marinifilum breve]